MTDELSFNIKRKLVCIKTGVEVEATEEEQDEDFNKNGFVALSWYYWLKESDETY